jgi:hypothetical protein
MCFFAHEGGRTQYRATQYRAAGVLELLYLVETYLNRGLPAED